MVIHLAGNSLTIKEAAQMCGGKIARDGEDSLRVCSVCTDSREVTPGSLFLCLRGLRSDGHKYIPTAAAKGAAGVLCEELPAEPVNVPLILVNNTIEALGALAKAYTKDLPVRRVAVTGSVGKTTTKEMIAGVLSSRNCFRTEGNFNSVIGMPLSLLRVPAQAGFAVFEVGLVFDVGFREHRQISHMSRIVSPEIAVVTNVGSSHMEHFADRKALIAEKLGIREGLVPGGTLLLSAALCGEAGIGPEDLSGRHLRTFSVTGEPADFRAENIREDRDGQSFDAVCPDGTVIPLRLGLYGIHNVQAALISAAVGYLSGIPTEEMQKAIAAYTPYALRQEVRRFGDITLITDCYNASPESMRAACDVLTGPSVGARRTFAVLGDMLELGTESLQMHRNTGVYFGQKGLQYLAAFGERAAAIAEGAADYMSEDRIARFADKENPQAPADWISERLQPGDAVLVKASRGMAAERISALLAEALRKR